MTIHQKEEIPDVSKTWELHSSLDKIELQRDRMRLVLLQFFESREISKIASTANADFSVFRIGNVNKTDCMRNKSINW